MFIDFMKNKQFTVAGLSLLLFFTECKEKDPIIIDELGSLGFSVLETEGFARYPPSSLNLEDSVVFLYSYTGKKPLKVIDISLVRKPINSQNLEEQVLIFESHYPKSNNVLETIRWKLDQKFGTTPSGFIEEVRFNKYKSFSFYIVD